MIRVSLLATAFVTGGGSMVEEVPKGDIDFASV